MFNLTGLIGATVAGVFAGLVCVFGRMLGLLHTRPVEFGLFGAGFALGCSIIGLTFDRVDGAGIWRPYVANIRQLFREFSGRKRNDGFQTNPRRRLLFFCCPLAMMPLLLVLVEGVFWVKLTVTGGTGGPGLRISTLMALATLPIAGVYAVASRRLRHVEAWVWQPASARSSTGADLKVGGDSSTPVRHRQGVSARAFLMRKYARRLPVFVLTCSVASGSLYWYYLRYGDAEGMPTTVIVLLTIALVSFLAFLFTSLHLFGLFMGFNGIPGHGVRNYCCPRCMNQLSIGELRFEEESVCSRCGQRFLWSP